jgi:hypothetical protein
MLKFLMFQSKCLIVCEGYIPTDPLINSRKSHWGDKKGTLMWSKDEKALRERFEYMIKEKRIGKKKSVMALE